MTLSFDTAASWLRASLKYTDKNMIHDLACCYDIKGRTYKQRNRELVDGEDDKEIQKSINKISVFFKESMETILEEVNSLPPELQPKKICELFSVDDLYQLRDFAKIVGEQLQDQSFRTLIDSFYSPKEGETTLDSLPYDFLLQIKGFLTEQDKVSLGMVSKSLRELDIGEKLSEYQIELILEYWIEFISEIDDGNLLLLTGKRKSQLLKELRFVEIRERNRRIKNRNKALEIVNSLCKLPWAIQSEKAAILFAEGISAGIPFPKNVFITIKPDWKPKTLYHLARALKATAPDVKLTPSFTIHIPEMPLVFPEDVKKPGDQADKALAYLYAFGEVLKSFQYFPSIKLTFFHPVEEDNKITLFDPRLASLLESIISHREGNIKNFYVRGSRRNWPSQGVTKVYRSLKKHQAECDVFFLGFTAKELESLHPKPKSKRKKSRFFSSHRT